MPTTATRCPAAEKEASHRLVCSSRPRKAGSPGSRGSLGCVKSPKFITTKRALNLSPAEVRTLHVPSASFHSKPLTCAPKIAASYRPYR